MEAKAIAKYVRMSPSKLKACLRSRKRQELERSVNDIKVYTWKRI